MGGSDGSGETVATGTVQFYVSDQPAAIEDFEHLNVTITQVGFERAESGEGDRDAENATATPGDANTTATAGNTTPVATTGNPGTATEEAAEAEEDAEAEGAKDAVEEDGERAGWETVEVDSRTVDLTRLRGDNATLVGTPETPAGEYTNVFVHVDSINATLTTGESVNVKLPSQKLQLNRGFSLEPDGTVQFVYDITVVEAGNSGKYILKPVISQSGPDQPIREVDDEGDGADDSAGPDDSDEREGEESDADEDETESDEADGTGTDGGEGGSPPDDRGNGN